MTLATDIASDYAGFDGVETVTLTPRATPGSPNTTVKALRGPVKRSEIYNLGGTLGLSTRSTAFSLFTASLAGTEPIDGDKITQGDGKVWIILSAELLTLGTRYRCLCNRSAG